MMLQLLESLRHVFRQDRLLNWKKKRAAVADCIFVSESKGSVIED
jgi:hypothetical protein